MSGLGSTAQRLNDVAAKVPGGARKILWDPLDISGVENQQKQKKNAQDLADQQAADAARAAEGPQAMTVRDQDYGAGESASDVVASGNEVGLGQPLGTVPRRRAARRVLIG